MVKMAQRSLKMDDASYRTMLRNVASVKSCKSLSQRDFEDVMAFFESMGYVDNRNGKEHWSNIVARRGSFASSRQIHMIRELYSDYESSRGQYDTHYELGGLVANTCKDRTRDPERLRPYEAHKLIEQLKSMISRLSPTSESAASSSTEPTPF